MIHNVGVDIVEINRIRKINNLDKFLQRFFTQSEINYILSKKNIYESIAGYFAAKEAVSKALGTGVIFRFTDIQIEKDTYGCPYVLLNNKALEIAKMNSINRIFISISHSENYATAFAIAEKEG
ncbi:holo-ACP synthase [Caldicellulosiruptoraceae bacterium PP1]